VDKLSASRARGIATDIDELDVTSETAWLDLADSLGEEPIHGLVNNAGIEGAFAPLGEYPTEMFRSVMDVNVLGVWLGMTTFAPRISDGGSIVNIASVAGIRGAKFFSAYSASKHAVVGLTRSAAKELAERGIRCNAVGPSPIDTRMMRSFEDGLKTDGVSQEEMKALIASSIPIGRYGEPSEVADLIDFLMGDSSQFLTGAIIPIDGAMTA
jgi:3alpha(or 20beta)-hydroxysteroid dehydrogenase